MHDDDRIDPRQLLTFALERYPERIETIELDRLMTDSARGNEKRPAWVKLDLPDEEVKALRGPSDKRSADLLLVRIPREVSERKDSRIILPGE